MFGSIPECLRIFPGIFGDIPGNDFIIITIFDLFIVFVLQRTS